MRAGTLRNKVVIQQQSSGQDDWGQPLPADWTDIATVWADIRHQSGLETIKADSPASVVKASIRIRYRTGLNAGMRVVHGDVKYDIKAVLPDVGSKQYVDLACEVVNG